MDTMTQADYRGAADYETRYESNYIYAKEAWLDKIEPIKQKFEHLIVDEYITDSRIQDLVAIVKGYEKLVMNSYNFFEDGDEGEMIEYDFLPELKKILKDEYNWEITDV